MSFDVRTTRLGGPVGETVSGTIMIKLTPTSATNLALATSAVTTGIAAHTLGAVDKDNVNKVVELSGMGLATAAMISHSLLPSTITKAPPFAAGAILASSLGVGALMGALLVD